MPSTAAVEGLSAPWRAEVGRVEAAPRRVRGLLAGRLVLDTVAAKLVWQHPYYPTWYVPAEDVDLDLLAATDERRSVDGVGTGRIHDVHDDDGAALLLEDAASSALADHVTIRFDALDAWFEEDEQVHVHTRNPYARVDVLASSRRIQVVVDGVEVADSTNAVALFETGLPTRWYLPKTDVRMDLLVPTDTTTGCPHKGHAAYYAVDPSGGEDPHAVRDDLAWWYATPLPESRGIEGRVCFYAELDGVELTVDGQPA